MTKTGLLSAKKLLTHGDSDVLNINEKRKMQQDMFLEAEETRETRKLFKELFFLPKVWL